jgi:DNA polymerase-3 subunit beta
VELAISRDTLFRALQTIQGVVENRSSAMPILQNVLVETEGNRNIRLLGTNLDISMRGVFEAEVEKAGKVTLNARKLFDIVRELPEAEVRFTEEDGQWIEMRCERSKFRFPGLPPTEFPALPESKESKTHTISASVLSEMIRKTMFAISQDETRYTYNGVFMETESDILRLVATDGHRLAMIERANEGLILDGGVIVHKKALGELVKLLQGVEGDISVSLTHVSSGQGLSLSGDEASASLTPNHIIFQMDNIALSARLIDGEFPKYRQVIPDNNEHSILMNRERLTQALRRVSLFTNETRMVKFEFSPGQLKLTTNGSEAGEAEEIIESNAQTDITIGFNSRYCLDALSILDEEEISMELKDSLSPGVLSPKDSDGYTYVVMPMRV